MPTLTKVLARTAAATSSTTLYTVPSSTTTVVSNIVICNPTTSGVTASLLLNDIDLLGGVTVAANSSAFFDLKQVLNTTQTIKGLASSTSVDFHISGVEIS
jgi:tRNA U34 5-carboxymethylaminomethyl modifying enzyme MnmG/GidA